MSTPSRKHIIIGIVCAILLLNILWTVMQNKFTPKLDEVKAATTSGMAALEQRIAKIEQGGLPDVAELKEDFASLRAISDKFAERLNKVLKAEEDQLAYLEALTAAQKARVEELKNLVGE